MHHLSALQPDILQLIINLPVLPNTSEEASETGSRFMTMMRIQTACALQLYTAASELIVFVKKRISVTAVPMHSVVRVFKPEVHHVVQFCANALSTLLQLHCRHGSFKKMV